MANQDPITFGWAETAKALFRERGITKGLWQVGASLRFAAANTGPNNDAMMPSAVVAIESIILLPADKPGPLVYDASSMNKAPVAGGKKATAPGGGSRTRTAALRTKPAR